MKNLLYCILLLPGLSAQAQENDKLNALAAALNTLKSKAPVEKVHLHLDKPYYSLGDTIWMKAYVVNENNELSSLSKIAYVALVNDKDSVKVSLKLPLTQGLGWGAITLSDTLLRVGNYHIKAYTNYMRNFGQEYYFDKSIKIGNALPPATGGTSSAKTQPVSTKNTAQTAMVKTDSVSIKFFPEGGNLVNGLLSKVAFKAIGNDGLNREVSGTIVDKDNKQVADFRSEHAGMGVFLLQPVSGNTYTAVIKLPDSSLKRVALPVAMQQGYILSVNQNESNVFVSISASSALLNSGEVSMVAQAANVVKYSGKRDMAHGGSTAIIPKSRFPEGIVQFTLFSPQFQPVAERLVFIRHTDNHLNIRVTPDKAGYQPRDKVHLNLAVTGQDGKPVIGSFSLAVTGEDKVPYAETDETTIFSNLLLSSDLKGYVEHPNYYFTDVSPDKEQQLDNLLLTQGWRRFVWKDVLAGTLPDLAYQPETGSGISGRILEKGKPAPGAKVNILVDEGKGGLLDTVTDANGRFSFDHLALAKGIKFNVTATDAAGKNNVTVEIDKEQNAPQLTFNPVPDEQPLTENFTAYLDNSSKRFVEMKKAGLLNSTMLKQVDIEEKVQPKTAKEAALLYSSNLGRGNADQVLTFMDLLPCIGVGNLADCLEGKLTNIHFIKTGPFNWVALSRGNTAKDAMLIVVDGVQQRLNDVQVEAGDIASIEVLRGGGAASLYGMHGANGVMIINTKKGGVDYTSYEEEHYVPGFTKAAGLQTYTFRGYDLRREFYSPDYDNPATNKQMADLRTTIYWAPNIITDKDGKASISFFNSDGTGSYRVITEGLDGQGKLGRDVDRYVVK